MSINGLAKDIYECFKTNESFTLHDAYSKFSNKPEETIRARIYENLKIKFNRIGKGIYKTVSGEESCILIEGDGRRLDFLQSESVDCIITDHPWSDEKSNNGGNRAFAKYECFKYNISDFQEKARVLKDGCFLVEVLPSENENNFEYLYSIKKYAQECGLLYYAKVTWKKGAFVSNTGRKAKNTQDIMIFSKGIARKLRTDVKKTLKTGRIEYMSGTVKMLPAMFDVPPVSRKNKMHQSELPLSLCEQIIELVTKEGEIILDCFAGSGVVGEASLNKKRNCILIEISSENILKIQNRFSNNLYIKRIS